MLRATHACALAMLSALAQSALVAYWRSAPWDICGFNAVRPLSWKLRGLVCCAIRLCKVRYHGRNYICHPIIVWERSHQNGIHSFVSRTACSTSRNSLVLRALAITTRTFITTTHQPV